MSHSRDRATGGVARRGARLRRPRRARRCRSRARAGTLARAARAQRQRQVDAAALHRRAAATACGHRARGRAGELRAALRPSARASPTPATGRCSGAGSARARTWCCRPGSTVSGARPRRRRWSWPTSRTRRSGRPRRSRRASASASRSLARCCRRRSLLVLDEPHSGLDEASSARLDALLADARGQRDDRARHARADSRAELLCDELLHLEVLR